MSLYNDDREVIDTSRFDLDACKGIYRKINNSSKSKIILTGPRTSGKTSTLMGMERDNIDTGNNIIYYSAKEKDYRPLFRYEELEWKYEFLISLNLIEYVKKYYPKVYKEQFKEMHSDVLEKYKICEEYVNFKVANSGYDLIYRNEELFRKWEKYKINKGDILLPLIDKIKNILDLDTLSLAVDRYDWIGYSSKRYQKIMQDFLVMFDKYIVTSDDILINNNDTKRNLFIDNGYDIIDVCYGKDYDTFKNIISRDIDYWKNMGKKINNYIDIIDIRDIISDDVYNKIIDMCNGDLGVFFDSLRQFYEYQYINYIDVDNNILAFLNNHIKDRYDNECIKKIKTLHLIKKN